MKRTKQMTKTPAQIVREIMRKHGKTMIWNNKNKTMRSVKCYGSMPRDAKMVKEITLRWRKFCGSVERLVLLDRQRDRSPPPLTQNLTLNGFGRIIYAYTDEN